MKTLCYLLAAPFIILGFAIGFVSYAIQCGYAGGEEAVKWLSRKP